jgi:hypothetical protein
MEIARINKRGILDCMEAAIIEISVAKQGLLHLEKCESTSAAEAAP